MRNANTTHLIHQGSYYYQLWCVAMWHCMKSLSLLVWNSVNFRHVTMTAITYSSFGQQKIKKKTKPTTNGIRCHWLTVLLTRISATPYKLRRFDRFSAMKCRRIQCIRNYISKYTYIWTNWPDIGMHSNFSDNLFDFVWIRALRCISTNTRQMIQNIILFVCFILSLPYEQSFNEKVHRQSKCSNCMPVHSTCHIYHARYIRCAYGTFKSISRLDR